MQEQENTHGVSRRTFVKAGLVTAAAASMPLSARADGPDDEKATVLPRRKLGRTGEPVTILNLGAGRKPTRRMLGVMHSEGIRYIDTADCYAQGMSEKAVGEWLKKQDNRKEYFVVTKDHPKTPDEWVEMIDRRLEALQTDYVDLFFVHGLGGGFRGEGDPTGRNWPKEKEWAAAAEKMKKAGKIKFAGFSTHTAMDLRIELLNNAVKGGWADAIMVATDPYTMQTNAEFNKALDNCHKAGIGLISMKEMRGVSTMDKAMPKFKEMGMTPQQAVLHAVWSDERFASICSEMPSVNILKENAEAARKFKKPLDEKKMAAVIDLYRMEGRFCNACDGSCGRAAGTKAALGDIARYLTYYELDGSLDDARAGYASLTPEERDWHGADLEAARKACHCHVDFAAILPRAEQKLA